MIEGEEGADEEGGILTENIIRLNAIESTALDDIEKKRWTKLQQSDGMENRIYYGSDMLIQSESASPGAGTYKYDLNVTGSGHFNFNKTIAKYDLATQEKVHEVVLNTGRLINPSIYPIITEELIIFRTIDTLTQSIVAVNLDLTEEKWVVEGDEILIDYMIYDNGNLYVIADDYGNGEYLLITIDAATGEVKEKLNLEGGSNNDPNTFYTYDGKVYIQIDEGTVDEFYYVIDAEDANRPLP